MMMIILGVISVVGKFWSHDAGWCQAVASVYSATTAASVCRRPVVAAACAESLCSVESHQRHNHDSVALAATWLTLSHAVNYKSQGVCYTACIYLFSCSVNTRWGFFCFFWGRLSIVPLDVYKGSAHCSC